MTGIMKELLKTALPLMAAALAATVNQFVDRLFLGHVSDVALEAITPVTVLTTVFSCVFLEVIAYSGTFVAQYSGRRRHGWAVRALTQGVWLAVATVPLILAIVPAGNLTLGRLGHTAELVQAERTYFDIVFPSFAFVCFSTALGAYFTAVRRAGLVGGAQIASCLANMLFDALLVPRFGMAGAAWASVLAAILPCLILGAALIRRRRAFRALVAPDLALLARIVRFALPNAATSFAAAAAFFFFVWATGRVSPLALAVSNVCFCINCFYYTLTSGLGNGVSALVGRFRGSGNDAEVRRTIRRAILLDSVLFVAMAVLFAGCGGDLADLFRGESSSFVPAHFHAVGASLFRIVILANVFETLQVTFCAALRGVGDTRYVMKATLVAECACWIPLIVLVLAVRPDIVLLWWTIVLWHGLCAALLVRRWCSGAWQRIRLI